MPLQPEEPPSVGGLLYEEVAMQPHPSPYQIPAQTAAVARAAFPKGSQAQRLADALGLLYEQADFATLYSATGRPGEDPVRLALVSIFQFLEGLSDRQAADAVRGRYSLEVCFGAGTHRSWF
jgi:transposase